MIYNPEGLSQSANNTLTWIYVLIGLFVVVMMVAIIAAFFPDECVKVYKWFKRIFKGEKTVKTVYLDKTKNFSGTEFLPVPMKAPELGVSYEFLGWNKFAKGKDGKFETQPIYLRKIKTCKITVYDENDNVLEAHEIEYGAGIKLQHKLVLKAPSKEFEYEFVGWDKETKAFFENTEIRPVFKAKPVKYTYRFLLDDGKTVIAEKTAISGTPIVCPSDPVKLEDDKFVYEFACFDGYKRGMVLDKDYEFIAMFEKVPVDSDAEKLAKQKGAIEVLVNEYKPKTKKANEYKLQDKQQFKTQKVTIEKNDKKSSAKKSEPEKPKEKSLLGGVIVEKNKSKKK